MSTVSGVGSASSAWADMSSARAGAMRDKMFAKVDADGNGSVDATELQGMLDHMSGQTGQALPSASDLMSKMDTDGNGTLSESELDNGMKSLMPAPSSTVDFAQQRTDGGSDAPSGAHHHHHGGPPPADALLGSTASDSSTNATSATSATDPLDTNGDGVVSPEERLAGDLQNLMSDLMASADANGDKSLNASELSTFKTNFDSALDSAIASTQAGGSSSGTSSGTSSDSSGSDGSASANTPDGVSLSSIVEMMLKQYGDAAAATNAQATTLSVAA